MPVTPLHSMPRPAVLFAGQGSEWQSFIAVATHTPATAQRLQEVLAQARMLIAPAARSVASTCPGAVERLEQLIGGEAEREPGDVLPAVSIPGIVLGQIAAIEQLRDLGVSLDVTAGHSQGSLGEMAVDKPAEALALALLMGTAATAVNGTDPRSQMLSVRGLERDFIVERLHGTADIAVVNGRRHLVLSGSPEDLAATRAAIEGAAAQHNAALEERTIGGDELEARFDELPVALPFHNPVLAMAAERTVALAQKCGLDEHAARQHAEAILVAEHNWPQTLDALDATHLIVLDRALTSITRRAVEGTGVVVVEAASPQAIDSLTTPGTELSTALNYADFAPRILELPGGRTVTQTRFSDLTGLSPVMLGGMTPTSADGEIVAAAANAGHWTEMAGGGMYSEEVFRAHLAVMEKHLHPGRTAQFNTMFFDRFLWNLQFGQARIVPKARAAGAPFNGVCISAGIPEVEEAGELLARLHEDGFPYISFKPGTAKQIRDVLAIAAAYPEDQIIVQIEDGHAGGHHSWVNLDDMLLETYAEIRAHSNVYLAVGGGIATPERATEYLTGAWAQAHGLPAMPVDAVFLGTVAMATKEAKATDSVKELLVNTPGIGPEDNGGWVGRGRGAHGVASSQSHLLADIHDLDNSFAAASRLITSLSIEEYPAHRQEIIGALAKTCKPYFGDVESMTYADWLERFVELAHPFVDPSWDDRFIDLLHRVEARLNPADHGQIETLFPTVEAVHDAPQAVAKLLAEYPAARTTEVSARDAAWWISLHYKHVKPMPWVPAIDGDLKSWFGKDTLWQAQDERYTADQVRIIPGPVAVAGITTKNEPVADLLARFEQATTDTLLEQGSTPHKAFSRLNSAADEAAFLRTAPTLLWHGHLMANPAHEMDENAFDLRQDADGNWEIVITADSYWDDLPEEQRPFYVREVTVPVDLPEDVATGSSPVVSEERLPNSVFTLLEGLAGVSSTAEQGDEITEMPTVESGYSFHFPASLLSAHSAVTCGNASAEKAGTPDVLVGPCWPAIYAALGSGRLEDGYPVIEGLLNAVHLDHVIDVRVPLEQLADGRQINVTSSCTAVEESASGRIVTVELELKDHASGDVVATQMHRFAIRGRATGTAAPSPAPEWGGGKSATKVVPTPRSFIDRATVTAPQDMTPFALVSGDYNPIHTSYNAAQLVNLEAPLVHGMWLSAAAQQVAGRHGRVVGWTYSMYGMVQLGDDIEITVERVGRKGIHQALEVTCRIDGDVVSRGQALLAAPRTAYVYPGQGIQAVGMGKGDRQASPAAREAWRRADAHTRANLGFSIQKIIDENPTELSVRGTTFRHPQGVLHLTQFTQVALAVVAYAQTERLRAEDALAPTSYFAGHSLGEYTALASLANIFDLEGVIDIVYSRGSAMGSLVPRDAEGNSEYAMAALRPNMAGIDADNVDAWVAEVAEATGEFLEIVNYNIRGQQYSIAGTKKALKALVDKANAIAPRAAVMVPGIDVPFHSRVLREGVPAFAEKLDELLPAQLDLDALVGRYIPNLVARPFELTQDFVDAVAPLAPSGKLDGLNVADVDDNELARLLLIELLSWQFASPVRWIETQEFLFAQVEQIIEVGLASSPTLTNLAERSLKVAGIPEGTIRVLNVERDQEQVMLADVFEAPAPEPVAESVAEEAPQADDVPAPAAPTAPAPAAVPSDAPELRFGAAEAIMVLFAFQNKIRVDQIMDSDTVEELTNGVSSRRNQLLMDMSAELGVPAIDGAADADVATLREKVSTAAPGYVAFGPVLGEAVGARLRQLFGAAGLKPTAVAEYVTGTWGLPESWIAHVEAEILLGSREEDSVRGGSLSTVPASATSKSAAHELIDTAVQAVAAAHGASVSKGAAAGGAGGGAVVDSAALDAFAETVTGENGVLATAARQVLSQLGLDSEPELIEAPDTTVIDAVEAELGSGWLKSVAPSFDSTKAVLFDDSWAIARERLARVALGQAEYSVESFRGTGEGLARQARWWKREDIAKAAVDTTPGAFNGEVALVTGAAPGSIATALVERLLEGGATVIMTASRVSQARKEFARTLYAEHGAASSALWLVPANLSSFRDIDALIDWIGTEQRESVGNEVKILKPALTPSLAFPFAAPSVSGSLADASGSTEAQARLLLWSVERTIAGLARLSQGDVDKRCHVVLPGSPNRGTFGGDGAYGEVKAALDAILNKWKVEAGWPQGVTLAQAKIGWVAGTHLMGGNDALVPAAEKAGIKVWSPEEISSELMDLASTDVREQAAYAPVEKDLTGGLEGFSLKELAADVEPVGDVAQEKKDAPATITALPNQVQAVQPGLEEKVGQVTTDLEDMVVIAGIGEVSSWGSGRTRFEAEYGLQRDGSAELTAAGVLELAWMTGLVEWREDPHPGWFVVNDDEEIAEEEIFERFRDEVVARCGIRTLTDKYHLTDRGSIDLTTVFLDRDVTFTVDSEATARDIQEADPEFVSIVEVDDEWQVTRRKGATVKVPRKATLTRTVAAQMPDDFDAAKWGIPEHMLDSLDRMAVWNLVTAVDAFTQAGFSPAELLRSIHPGQVATTQGTGIGGMESLHKVFVSRFLGEERPSDILQEALPNVIAAHTMQSLVGGYGSMIHPIGACATAAVSIEEAVDKIALGKADVVVAGGIDDVQVESLQGFGDMNATAETATMTAKGIDDRFISRANDRRRGGFLEGEGGGTVLLVRASLAADLGLPVLAVVAHAASYGDGAHTSIPAPGLGALGAGRGRENSRLARSLRGLGLTPNDVRVLSKHDTSTNANDPNESELHSLLWPAIGRDKDQPMFVISQKTLTGHSKAGAALFQTGGIIDVFRTHRIPANVSLDCVDPLIAPKAPNLVWLRSPLDLAAAGHNVKAAALTSLGFGHVSALIVYAHPGVFEQAVAQQRGADAAASWRERAESRLRAGRAHFEAGMLGRAPLFEVIEGRRLPAHNAKAAEIAMLLDDSARLSEDGTYPEN
ncbi:type I polyketide synthase [Corynebacterium minutissimum]|uniref:Fatty acid synthase n=1 Tax=Corynebacterium minutissimum TaxID=38301 RepID=A0A2X4RFA7_9CORY|nr:type I polyketide synthase [Corynebacterium minutissimum]KHO30260.1 ACP S-malonyltransferase [Corynebacterium minutissimum]QPS60236.1 type I polyketide synthase [Corynebacterium minutissimum]QQA78974.1 type I polyketide synthase [Corynebacterium minutissimum]SQI00926.1 fatty acid synthase [Corynebacterium minutissimum]VEG05006.1 fatty acid synthase [Corynebacterium minutissimum]